jgi:hypothetical protein
MFAPVSERAASAAALATAIRPTAPAATRLLPVLAPLVGLLPDGALRRGATVAVVGTPGMGATSLGLSLLAATSAAGHWGAVVGLDDPGVVAMAELGVDLGRVVFVPRPRGAWAVAVSELLEGVDVVVVRPPGRVAHTAARRLLARVRERAVVLVVLVEGDGEWPVAKVDVTDAAALDGFVDATAARFGRLDGVVSNAGRASGGAVVDSTDDAWRAD